MCSVSYAQSYLNEDNYLLDVEEALEQKAISVTQAIIYLQKWIGHHKDVFTHSQILNPETNTAFPKKAYYQLAINMTYCKASFDRLVTIIWEVRMLHNWKDSERKKIKMTFEKLSQNGKTDREYLNELE